MDRYGRRHPGRVEDYTTANLILIFVNLLWIFGVIWSVLGLWAVLIAGWFLNLMITRLAAYKEAREAASAWIRKSGQRAPD